MNQHVHISLTPGMILLIVAGLVILSMFMSGKNKHRSSLGWWVGLGVLLLVLSGIYTTRNIGARVEERYKDQSYSSRFREDLQSSLGQFKESLHEGMTQLKKGLSDSRDALNAAVASSTNPGQRKSGVTVVRNLGTAARTPRNPYVSTVQLKDREHSSKKEQVEQRLYERAMQYIANWVRERMPLRDTPVLNLDLAWLKDNGVFPEPVQFTEQDIPRANTQETDKLYGGSLKLVLSPDVQVWLLDQGYISVDNHLQYQKFTTQWIISVVLGGLTILIALLALVRTSLRGYSAISGD